MGHRSPRSSARSSDAYCSSLHPGFLHDLASSAIRSAQHWMGPSSTRSRGRAIGPISQEGGSVSGPSCKSANQGQPCRDGSSTFCLGLQPRSVSLTGPLGGRCMDRANRRDPGAAHVNRAKPLVTPTRSETRHFRRRSPKSAAPPQSTASQCHCSATCNHLRSPCVHALAGEILQSGYLIRVDGDKFLSR